MVQSSWLVHPHPSAKHPCCRQVFYIDLARRCFGHLASGQLTIAVGCHASNGWLSAGQPVGRSHSGEFARAAGR